MTFESKWTENSILKWQKKLFFNKIWNFGVSIVKSIDVGDKIFRTSGRVWLVPNVQISKNYPVLFLICSPILHSHKPPFKSNSSEIGTKIFRLNHSQSYGIQVALKLRQPEDWSRLGVGGHELLVHPTEVSISTFCPCSEIGEGEGPDTRYEDFINGGLLVEPKTSTGRENKMKIGRSFPGCAQTASLQIPSRSRFCKKSRANAPFGSGRVAK